MRRERFITFIVMILLLPLFTCAAQAAEQPLLALSPGESFSLPISELLLPEQAPYSLKVCFSTIEIKPPLGDCEGQTWNGEKWLRSTAPWRDFPVSRDIFALTGRYSGSVLPPYLHIIGRAAPDGTKSVVLSTWRVAERSIENTIQLRVFTEDGKALNAGYVRVFDASISLLPLDSPSTEFSTSNKEVAIEILDSAGRVAVPVKNYYFSELNAHYTLEINRPAAYQPLLTLPTSVPMGSEILGRITTSRHYPGRVIWKRNGKVVSDEGLESRLLAIQPGTYLFEVQLEDTHESVRAEVTVLPITQVKIATLTPNPDGVDAGGRETICFTNAHPFEVSLAEWKLRRREAATTVPLFGVIAAQGSLCVPSSSKLMNDGGTYDLFTRSGDVVDTIIYPKAASAEVLTRDGMQWHSNLETLVTARDTPVIREGEVTGRVVRPRGRIVDIVTPDETPVHVVIHTSYDLPRPKLRQGDTIYVTGEWKTSRSGPYLSVRLGDVFELLSVATQPRKKSRGAQGIISVIPRAKAAEVASAPQASAGNDTFAPLERLFANSLLAVSFEGVDSPPNVSVRLWLVILFSVGCVLVLPFSRDIPV